MHVYAKTTFGAELPFPYRSLAENKKDTRKPSRPPPHGLKNSLESPSHTLCRYAVHVYAKQWGIVASPLGLRPGWWISRIHPSLNPYNIFWDDESSESGMTEWSFPKMRGG